MNFTFLMQIFVAPVTTSTKPTSDLERRLPVNPNVVLADIGTIATDSEIGGHGSTAVQGSGLDHLATTTGQECAVSGGKVGVEVIGSLVDKALCGNAGTHAYWLFRCSNNS